MRRGRVPLFLKELLVFIIASTVTYKLSFFPVFDSFMQEILAGRRKELYAAILGLHGTLLGFIIAAITIAMTYVSSPRFEILRQTRHWPHLFGSYTRSMRWVACTTLFSLLALLIDYETAQNRLLAILCFNAVFYGGAMIVHTLWVTEKTVKVAISAKPRLPGE